jgi:hypothetical protein
MECEPMKYLPPNTLAYFNAMPQCHRHDLSKIPVSAFGASTLKFRKVADKNLVSPNTDALTFYALNHVAAIVKRSFTPNEALPSWAEAAMRAYASALVIQSERMLHYILTITTREMRHWAPYGHFTQGDWNNIIEVGTEKMQDFIKSLTDCTEDASAKKYMTKAPDVSVGQYLNALSVGFHRDGKGWGGSYGGVKWGLVTDAAVEAIHGKTSLEMLVDTGYTLAHNGGPIFNKGMIYDQFGASLYTILDVQASGQIPDLILDGVNYSVEKPESVCEIVKLVWEHHPKEFAGHVDWTKVTSKGGHHQHLYEKWAGKVAQKVAAKAASKPAPKKSAPPVEKLIGGKKVTITGTWDVFPGQSATIYERTAP